jgi:hypothetical protein
MNTTTGKIIRIQSALKHHLDLDWFADFNYTVSPNQYGYGDLIVIADDDYNKAGDVLEGAIQVIKSTCPDCGEPNYDAFFQENDEQMIIKCHNCQEDYEITDYRTISRYR